MRPDTRFTPSSKNVCIWNKSNGGMGSFYRSKHEHIFVWKSGTAAHTNNFELGQHGRYRTNVWDYAGVNTFGSERMDELQMHPTVKPVALVADAIKDCSKQGDVFAAVAPSLLRRSEPVARLGPSKSTRCTSMSLCAVGSSSLAKTPRFPLAERSRKSASSGRLRWIPPQSRQLRQ